MREKIKMIEQHVTNLEFSTELKELGYPQNDSLFYWVKEVGTQNWHIAYKEQFNLEVYIADEIAIAAPLASELLSYFGESYVLKIAPNLHDYLIVEDVKFNEGDDEPALENYEKEGSDE
jgi:hypothetical protein